MDVYFLFDHFKIHSKEQLEKLISRSNHGLGISKNSIILIKRQQEIQSEYIVFIYDKNAKLQLVSTEIYVFFSFGNEIKFENEFVSSSSTGPFVSFARREEVYLDIYNQLEEKTWTFLNSIRDYHYLRTHNAEANPLKNILENTFLDNIKTTKSFRYMQRRGFEEFMYKFRYKRGYPGVSTIDLSMKLRSVRTPVKVHFDFSKTGIVPSRIAVIIGKNGVGKSRCLKEVKNQLVDGASYRKVIAINLYQTVNRPRTPHYVSLNIDPRKSISFASAISGIIEKRRKHDYFDSVEILRDVLRSQMRCSDVKVLDSGDRWVSVWEHQAQVALVTSDKIKFFKDNGEEFVLSQGQVYLLSVTMLLLLYVEQNTIVLFDEPEIYLHPNYIVKIVSLLEFILERTNSVAILATHSIFLIRELPKTSVYTLFEDGDGVRMISPITETLGANLDRLAYEFFSDEDVVKKYEAFVAQKSVELKKEKPKKRLEAISKLPADLATKVLSNV